MICLTRLRPGKKGVIKIELLTAFVLSVMASIAAHYICKWLDDKDIK